MLQKALMESALLVTVCRIPEGLAAVNDIIFLLRLNIKYETNQYQFPSSPASTRGLMYFNILKYSLNAAVAVCQLEKGCLK